MSTYSSTGTYGQNWGNRWMAKECGVEVDGTVMGTYPLSVDREVEIVTGENGEELNLLVIKDGKAIISTATCPDGICAAHKPISREGESIICLPHKVVITVIGGSGEEPDIIA